VSLRETEREEGEGEREREREKRERGRERLREYLWGPGASSATSKWSAITCQTGSK
jgi:hypothetical protein